MPEQTHHTPSTSLLADEARDLRGRIDWSETLRGYAMSLFFTMVIGAVLGLIVFYATRAIGGFAVQGYNSNDQNGSVSHALSILVALWASFLGFFAGISIAELHDHSSRLLNAMAMFVLLALTITVAFAIDAVLGFPLEHAVTGDPLTKFGIVHYTVFTTLVGAFAATFLATGEEPGQEQIDGRDGPADLH